VTPGLSFRGFRRRAARNPHGWGLAAIGRRRATIAKEPLNAERSAASAAIAAGRDLAAPVFIGHVRAASCGGVSLENTHPFTRRINGSDFVFAHNGTLDTSRFRTRTRGPFDAEGDTDSEAAMCALLNWMRHDGVSFDDHALIEEFLRAMNVAGDLNLLFADGRQLFCYHDHHGYNGLCWTHRRPPFGRVSLRDEDWEADLGAVKCGSQQGYVIASRRLTDGETWEECRPGGLMVFRDGAIVYGG
jgi:glutamine amidotransferase